MLALKAAVSSSTTLSLSGTFVDDDGVSVKGTNGEDDVPSMVEEGLG